MEKTGEFAERYLYSDSNSCLFKLGLLCEDIVNKMFDFDNIRLPYQVKDTLVNKIRLLENEEYITEDLARIMHRLRLGGNEARHEGKESLQKAKLLLPQAHSLCEWFMQVYGDYSYTPQEYHLPEEQSEPDFTESKKDKAEEARLRKQDEEKAQKAVPVPQQERSKKNLQAASKRPKTEAETRCLIDEQLRQVGWEADTTNLRYSKGSRPAKGRNLAIAEWPTDKVPGNEGKGYADYVLFTGMELVGIIEAKKWDTDISSVISYQCKDYARAIRQCDEKYLPGQWQDYKVPFVFAANGRPYVQQLETKSGIWFADLRQKGNIPRALAGWPSPLGLKEMLQEDAAAGNAALKALPYDFLKDENGLHLRDYQLKAVQAVDDAVRSGKQTALLAMATGTGKTRTVLGMIYRFLKTKRFKRILFLVDRNALGVQAQDVFKEVKLESLQTLDQIYNIKELTDKLIDAETAVHVATVQGMVKRIMYAEGEERIPAISDYDLIIIDEAHRGYILDKEMAEAEQLYRDQRDYQSKYRYVLDYFNAVKIALTATPALQTTEIFGEPVYTYTYREAVLDGYLIDHDAPHQLKTKLSEQGIKIKKGDPVKYIDKKTGKINSAYMDDDLDFDVEQFNRKVIVPEFNRAVLAEIAKNLYPDAPETYGKTLIYAATDSHADMIVSILQELFAKEQLDSDAIMKITGSVANGDQKKIQEKIKRFKNERFPSIVVTVDLLTTGIDVPEITTLVFMRCVKSRILFEQMLGRATRRCDKIGKDHFEIYDPVGVYDSLQSVVTMPAVANPQISMKHLLEQLAETEEPEAITDIAKQLALKLRRRMNRLDEQAKKEFVLATGKDVAVFAGELQRAEAAEAKALLQQHKAALAKLEEYRAGGNMGGMIYEGEDELTSHTRGYGAQKTKPRDYLQDFAAYLKSHANEIAALNIICTRPKDLTKAQLKELLLTLDANGFTELQLNNAYSEYTNSTMVAGIISLIRRYMLGTELVSKNSQLSRAFDKLNKQHKFTPAQQKWLEIIRSYMQQQDILSVEAFKEDKRLQRLGGYARAQKIFADNLESIVSEFNGYLYEDGGKTA
ncbi:type I restriction-modification system endonuclease [uncultured Phascolarctobacterium sp.]|uniref:type I restriction-modification system endonuclease n=1 Tax=uncultured Phascolarctobacterium sp. TaxID=512296 RepID=UPI0026007CFC|nr:type I restriction-modification system endonuclease [uncultured Phascolarctobacterium sp.]